MYFSGGLTGPCQTRFAKRVRDCDELASSCYDHNLIGADDSETKSLAIETQSTSPEVQMRQTPLM